MVNTRINYDMLDYLPDDMDTVIGQNELMEDFGKGAFSMLVIEDMPEKDVAALKNQARGASSTWTRWSGIASVADLSVPMQLLPDKIYNEFNTGDATMMAVFFDSATSRGRDHGRHPRDPRDCRKTGASSAGMSALVTDLKDLCEQEEPIYVAHRRGAARAWR